MLAVIVTSLVLSWNISAQVMDNTQPPSRPIGAPEALLAVEKDDTVYLLKSQRPQSQKDAQAMIESLDLESSEEVIARFNAQLIQKQIENDRQEINKSDTPKEREKLMARAPHQDQGDQGWSYRYYYGFNYNYWYSGYYGYRYWYGSSYNNYYYSYRPYYGFPYRYRYYYYY